MGRRKFITLLGVAGCVAADGAGAALPRERFSRVLGMFSSLEVKVLYPT
jgi:hypothetical protein